MVGNQGIEGNGQVTSKVNAALRLAGIGWLVLPDHEVLADGNCSCGNSACKKKGKHPRISKWQNSGTTDEATIRGWFTKWPTANIGILAHPKTVFMIGPDGDQGMADLAHLEEQNGKLPPCPRQWSGTRPGQHLIFAWPEGLVIKNRQPPKNGGPVHRGCYIDVRADGGQFVVAPSRNGSGPYEWIVPPWDVPAPVPPDWLLRWLEDDPEKVSGPTTAKAKPTKNRNILQGKPTSGNGRPDTPTRAAAWLAAVPGAISGQGGHAQTFAAARGVVYGFDLGVDVGFELLRDNYNSRCKPEWTDEELLHKCQEADSVGYGKDRGHLRDADGKAEANGQHEPGEPPDEPTGEPKTDQEPTSNAPKLTDQGNAERLALAHGRDCKWVPGWERWIVWDGTRWAMSDSYAVRQRAVCVIKELCQWANEQIKKLGGEDAEAEETAALLAAMKIIRKHAIKCEAVGRLNAMVDLLISCPGQQIDHGLLDAGAMLLNCPNGTLDLRTGELRESNRDDLLTKLCPTPYDASAECPTWERTLTAIFGGDQDMVNYFQRLTGYCLTGSVREQILPVLWGSGSNGKSLLFTIILSIFGTDYSGPAARDLVMTSHNQAHPTGLANLFGKRLVTFFETQEGGRINEGQIKELTGGDDILARRMREDFWRFAPSHKIWLATNHKPVVRGQDHGIWRRLRLLPFTVQFWDVDKGETGPADLKADKFLEEKLLGEAPGILAWMVRGCLAWQAGGLREPKAVLAATAEYRDEQNIVKVFVEDRCVRGESHKVRAGQMHAAYKSWHEARCEPGRPLGQRHFSDAIEKLGITSKRSGGIWYEGIDLRFDPPDESPTEGAVPEYQDTPWG